MYFSCVDMTTQLAKGELPLSSGSENYSRWDIQGFLVNSLIEQALLCMTCQLQVPVVIS